MRGRLRVDITESDYPLTVQHYRGPDLSGRDPAEQAVWHSTIIVAREQYPMQAWPSLSAGTGDNDRAGPLAIAATAAADRAGR
jgi:hypothetical protein